MADHRRCRFLALLRDGRRAVLLGAALMLVACGQTVPSPSPPAASTSPASITASAPGSHAPTTTSTSSPGAVRFRILRFATRLLAARSRAIAFGFGSTILVCGGLTSVGATTGSTVRIDLASGRVAPTGVLAAPVHDAGGAVLDHAGYIFGGGRFGPGSIVQRVSPDGSSETIGHLPAVRADLAAVVLDGQIIIVGGGTPATPDDLVLATRDGRTFHTIARLRVAVRYPAIAALGGTIYVIGGSTFAGDTRLIQAIDPRTGVVRVVGHLPHGLSHAGALVIGGELLVAGGRSSGRAQDNLWRFDPGRGTVSWVGRLPYAVSDMAVVVIDGTGYLIGGEGGTPLATIITIAVR